MRAITLEETQFVSVRLSSGRLEDRAVQGINVQGVSDGLVSLLFLSNHVEGKKKRKEREKNEEKPRKINEQRALMSQLDAFENHREDRNKRSRSNNDGKANRRWNRWKKKRKKKRWIAKRYWISQLNKPPTLQIGGWIFLEPSSGVARALKTSWTDPDKGWRGKHRQGGELAIRKKIHRGPFLSLSLFPSLPLSLFLFVAFTLLALELEKEERGAGSVKVEGWRGLDGEGKFCKGGTDGGGGRAKGKTTAKRHSWTPLKTWPRW